MKTNPEYSQYELEIIFKVYYSASVVRHVACHTSTLFHLPFIIYHYRMHSTSSVRIYWLLYLDVSESLVLTVSIYILTCGNLKNRGHILNGNL